MKLLAIISLLIGLEGLAQKSFNLITSADTADMTDEINAFINSVPDGTPNKPNVINFPSNGTYRSEGELLVANRNNLVINGNGATIFATTPGKGTVGKTPNRNRAHWQIEKSSGITVKNFKIIGANKLAGETLNAYVPALEAQHGFDLQKSTNIIIRDNEISKVYGDFIYINGGSNIRLVKNRGDGNGRQGIAIVAGKNILIDSNQLRNMRMTVIDIECNYDYSVVDSVVITNNDFGKSRHFLFSNGGQSYHVSNIYFANNTIQPESGRIHIKNSEKEGKRTNYVFVNNTFLGFRGSAKSIFNIAGVDGVVIKNNKLNVSSKWKMVNGVEGSVMGNIYLK